MQDKERELEEFEASHTLGGAGEGRVIALGGAFFFNLFPRANSLARESCDDKGIRGCSLSARECSL